MPVSRRSRYGPHSATSLHLPQLAVSVSASISGTTTNEPDLGALTKDQLKAECRRRGQKTNGTKAELLQRLGHKMALSPVLNKALSKAEQGRNGDVSVSVNSVRATSNGNHSKMARERLRVDRKALVPWRHPITTFKYASLESWILMQTYGKKFLEHRTAVVFLSGVFVSLCVLYNVAGPHQPLLEMTRVNLGFVLYWTGLGVLSSVGFGTGLHTFLLYLGPHIAAVTIAAYECDSLHFPEPPYPEEIVCPSAPDPTFADSVWIMQVMAIMSKVRLEAFLWGMGTALGELPPYFMARAARFSGYDPEDAEDLAEFEELQKRLAEGANLGLVDRAKLVVEKLVERVGFLGILACASIPNPLFDLAGITCGHFLVPFWTFFGATLIGKAVVKMHIQKIFVIIAFNETLIEEALQLLALVPMIGPRLQEPFKKFLNNQKTRLHRQGGAPVEGGNVLASVFEVLVFVMVLYFVLSIIKSLAQRYHKRVHKKGGPRRKIARD